MPLSEISATVSAAPTLLLTAAAPGESVIVQNAGSVVLYVGGASVTVADGFAIAAGDSYSLDMSSGLALYGVVASGTCAVNLLHVPVSGGARALAPVRLSLAGSGGTTSPAQYATTVAGLGSAATLGAGTIGYIEVGTWPDVEVIEVVSDGARWVQTVDFSLTAQLDQTYMGTNTTAYSYVGQSNTGSATTIGQGWSTRPIRNAAALFAAGLKLQCAPAAIGKAAAGPSIFTVIARFFQHNSGDAVVFSSDGSTAVGESQTIATPNDSSNNIFMAPAWADVYKLGTTTALSSADVTKSLLWPRLYAKVASGTNYGSVIDFDVRCRWYG